MMAFAFFIEPSHTYLKCPDTVTMTNGYKGLPRHALAFMEPEIDIILEYLCFSLVLSASANIQ